MEPTPLKIRLVTLWTVVADCSYTRKRFPFSRESSGLAGILFSDLFGNGLKKIASKKGTKISISFHFANCDYLQSEQPPVYFFENSPKMASFLSGSIRNTLNRLYFHHKIHQIFTTEFTTLPLNIFDSYPLPFDEKRV